MYIKMHFSIPETVDRRDAKGSVYTVRNNFIIKHFQGVPRNWGSIPNVSEIEEVVPLSFKMEPSLILN